MLSRTGRNPRHASVAVTEGILNLLNDDEMEGVLAHELGHVRNRDILISSIAATIAGAITMLARMAYWGALFGGMGGRSERDREGGSPIAALLMMILAPFAAMLIQLAISRSREYAADETGAHFTGNPYALASALKKLDQWSQRIPMAASPSTAHLYIVKPMLGEHGQSVFDASADRRSYRPPHRHASRAAARKLMFSGVSFCNLKRDVILSRSAERLWPEQPRCVPDVVFDKQ